MKSPGDRRGAASGCEPETTPGTTGNGEQHTKTRPEVLEAFRRSKVAYDFLVRNGGTASELDDALAALNKARADLQYLAELGR